MAEFEGLDKAGATYLIGKVKDLSGTKVDKVEGKGLSSNDYTTEEKTKLAGLSNYELPTASATVKGGIKVGDGLKMDGDVLSATASTKVYKPKGSVATYSALPTEGNEVGDVYNVEDTGMNYAWTDKGEWDALGGIVDLSGYLKKTDIVPITNAEIDAMFS